MGSNTNETILIKHVLIEKVYSQLHKLYVATGNDKNIELPCAILTIVPIQKWKKLFSWDMRGK